MGNHFTRFCSLDYLYLYLLLANYSANEILNVAARDLYLTGWHNWYIIGTLTMLNALGILF